MSVLNSGNKTLTTKFLATTISSFLMVIAIIMTFYFATPNASVLPQNVFKESLHFFTSFFLQKDVEKDAHAGRKGLKIAADRYREEHDPNTPKASAQPPSPKNNTKVVSIVAIRIPTIHTDWFWKDPWYVQFFNFGLWVINCIAIFFWAFIVITEWIPQAFRGEHTFGWDDIVFYIFWIFIGMLNLFGTACGLLIIWRAI